MPARVEGLGNNQERRTSRFDMDRGAIHGIQGRRDRRARIETELSITLTCRQVLDGVEGEAGEARRVQRGVGIREELG